MIPAGGRDLQRLSQPYIGCDPCLNGLNFFDASEQILLRTLQLGKFAIHDWRGDDLLFYRSRHGGYAMKSSHDLSRLSLLVTNN